MAELEAEQRRRRLELSNLPEVDRYESEID